MNRPFFSIIVPCYNSKKERIIPLLKSIYNAGCNDITEVIIVDGNSEDKEYLEMVNVLNSNSNIEDKRIPFKLNIKVVEVPEKNEDGIELIHCPGNTREYGVRAATGQWITFIDHDDEFVYNSLSKIKEFIEESEQKYIVCGHISDVSPDNVNKILYTFTRSYNWLHGKFYNLDNFWNKYDFHFPINQVSHEDNAISSKLRCILNRYNIQESWLEEPVYLWKKWLDSTSNMKYDNRSYLNYNFKDYISSTIGVYTEMYNTETNKESVHEFYTNVYIDVILFLYFYIQSFKFNKKVYNIDYDEEYDSIVKKTIKETLDRINITSDFLIKTVIVNDCKWYEDCRNNSKISEFPFIEVDSFFDYIKEAESIEV